MSTTRTGDEIARELEAFYRHYIDVFNREDDGFYDCFANPYALISGERGITTIGNDNRDSFARTMKVLKEQGWQRSGIDRITAWALADNLGMIVSDVTRYKSDGAVMEKIRASYMLRRDSDRWKIVTITEVKPPYLGPGNIARS
jgi:hypothetical protein